MPVQTAHAADLAPCNARAARGHVIAAGNARDPTGPYTRSSAAATVRQMTALDAPEQFPPPNVHGAKRFLVKVQIDGYMTGQPHIVYDQKRSIILYVEKQQPAYPELLKLVRLKGFMGLKAYLWCKRASDTTLRIFTEGMPSGTRMPLW
ncbi:hypothetical protein WJX73_008173 [Symbiochloris irregularis]|uniref:LAGLIDADG homing endonuclease n=1 Tax=Symbiochloris irregularis TaxID=706552 RepID=A0AAW1PYV6_9CHLO